MLYGLTLLMKDSQSCYECGYFQAGQNYPSHILEAIKTINGRLRPQIINIIESTRIPDEQFPSAIGNSYGDIYETHLAWSQNSRLNKTKAGDAIPDGFLEHMLPVLQSKL